MKTIAIANQKGDCEIRRERKEDGIAEREGMR